ncbi:MAG: hypothetical protein CL674_15695 [Bdellovibrionaceae bacterium]|nr:hypothetical protein [Pseudobdellovibrionaceae bacterium]
MVPDTYVDMGHNNDDDKTKRYVDFLTDDENQDFDILNRAEVDESAEDFDPAAMSNSIELESSESEESQEAIITGPRTFLADELGLDSSEALVKNQDQDQDQENEASAKDESADESLDLQTSLSIEDSSESFKAEQIAVDESSRNDYDPDFSYAEFANILQDATSTKEKSEPVASVDSEKEEEPTEEISWSNEVSMDEKSSEEEAAPVDVQADYATAKIRIKEEPVREEVAIASEKNTDDHEDSLFTEEPLTKNSLRMGSDTFRDEATDKLSKKKIEQAIKEEDLKTEKDTNSGLSSEESLAKEKPNTSSISQTAVDYSAGKTNEVAQEEPRSKVSSLHEHSGDYETSFRATQAQSTVNQPNLQSNESLRLAQDKILDLESELEKLRIENQELAAAGEVLKRKLNEQDSSRIKLDKTKQEIEQQLKEEVEHSQLRIQAKNQEIAELRVKVESLELRLQRDLQRVRSRERELENRLEIVRLENSAVLRSKDEHILELKRKLDQKDLETEQLSERLKSQIDESKEKQEKIKRTIRTLRLALNMLDEAEDDIKMKKTG